MDQDLSEKTYQSLVETEEMYRQIIEFSTETIIIHSDHKVLFINQSGADFLKAPKEVSLGPLYLILF
jgi:rsbT co-antagonist protein RsbR